LSRPADKLDGIDRALIEFMGENAIPLARIALGITYVWFGALKLFGVSPVADLVRKTSPISSEKVVLATGLVEVVIGFGLLFRVALRLTLALFFLQLLGTFMVMLRHPQETFQRGNPLVLTERGEFIVKNLVLLAAGLAVGSTARRQTEKIPVATGQPADVA
jgi:uncharacterized membrane protein